jgi:glycosyltransferase involved in cell wall biosynthesis
VKVTYVVPRYGLEVVGGAEYAARMLAERLVGQLGWEVDVMTTCALDTRTWADEYEPGTVELNGVAVHRFRSASGRDPGFERFSSKVLVDPARVPRQDQERWIDLQGPRNPDVIAAARASDADVVVFYPYLFHPTVHGVPALGRRAVMHPAAHDEPPLRLPLFRRVFAGARGLVFQTFGERRLVEGLFPVAATRQIVLGLGVEEGPGAPEPARQALGIGERPYVVCVGRVDDGKGTGMLASFFAAYKERHPGPLQLVLVGPVSHPPLEHPDVIVAGAVDDATKWGAIRGAEMLISPSAFEAFSIVLVEAWTVGKPVVVHGRCLATREHCERSGGGLWFDGYASFEVVLDRLLADADLRRELGARGQDYVEANYRWPALIERYGEFLRAVAATV